MSAPPTLYYSAGIPHRGWWVATVPTLHGFRVICVHRDPDRTARRSDILTSAARNAPEVAEWVEAHVLPDGRPGFFTGHASVRGWAEEAET